MVDGDSWFLLYREVSTSVKYCLQAFEFCTTSLTFTALKMSRVSFQISTICGKFWSSVSTGKKVQLKRIECLWKFIVKPVHPGASTPKPNIHGAKVMLCIWWDQKDVIHYKLLKPGRTITRDFYRQQLIRLNKL